MRSAKALLYAGVLFLMSAYFSFVEFKFLLWGQTATADVTSVREVQGSRKKRPYRVVEYRFTEADGAARSERDDVPTDYPAAEGSTITVQYLPGVADSSRLEGTAKMMWVYIFCGALAWVIWSVFSLYREAQQPGRSMYRRA